MAGGLLAPPRIITSTFIYVPIDNEMTWSIFFCRCAGFFGSGTPERAAASIDSRGRLRRRSRAAGKFGIRGCPSARSPSKSTTSESGQGIPTSGQSIPTSGQKHSDQRPRHPDQRPEYSDQRPRHSDQRPTLLRHFQVQPAAAPGRRPSGGTPKCRRIATPGVPPAAAPGRRPSGGTRAFYVYIRTN